MPTRPTIVVTDYNFPDLSLEQAIAEQGGCTLHGTPQAGSAQDMARAVAAADAVITQFARVDASVIGAMARARAIVRYGIGVDNVDLAAARAHGIPVANIPDYCIDEVADHTLSFVLGLTRQVVAHTRHVRAGQWGLAVPVPGMRVLREQTVGVVGFGRIGRAVVQRLRAFGCTLLVHDPVVPGDAIAEAGARAVPLADLLAQADIVSLHCPSTPHTRHLVDARSLATMRRGALLVNLSRGDLVDTPALVAALESGQLGAAALDVFDPEPLPADHALRKLPNVIVAPHIASVSPTAVRALREGAARRAVAAARGELPANVVNGVVAPRVPA
jgi:D-3-phosphoglycerate dehydrogenase